MTDKKSHWQNIYKDKSPLEVSWFQKEPATSLELTHKTGISHKEPIIDVGGGSSVLVDYLFNEGYKNISVLDISANALAASKARQGKDSENITWIEADITEFSTEKQFSLWHDRAVFHFLVDKKDRNLYVQTLKKTLCKNGHLIIATFSFDGPKQCSGLDIVQYDAETLMAELGSSFDLVEEKFEVHITPAGKEQSFNYFHFTFPG